jgi:hypothetical protein
LPGIRGPKGEGGQRWFHLYPKQKSRSPGPLHWTGLYQNWALQCAECHSTNLRKGYDAASHTYKTTFSEINVACESCHGPASAHVDWARKVRAPYRAEDSKGPAIAAKPLERGVEIPDRGREIRACATSRPTRPG